MYPNELCLHILVILLFTSSTNGLATLLLKTIPDIITLPTSNDRFLFDRFLFCKRLLTPKSTKHFNQLNIVTFHL